MARTVFRPVEVVNKDDTITLQFTKNFAPPVEEVEEEEEEYKGPTAEELKKEADEFKEQWEAEKADMLSKAQEAANKIVKDAEDAAFAEVKRQSDQAAVIKEQAQNEAKAIVDKARSEADEILARAKEQEKDLLDSAKAEGLKTGNERGYEEGKKEADRLIERLRKMIEAVQAKRQEILDGTEEQIVNLVILISRKVVKIISETQKNVLTENVLQALKKVKGSCEVTLRVNMDDVQLATEHTEQFIKQVENIKNVTVVEDGTVEKGGCIVETDFGAIDARIASQLSELETQILNISPIKSVDKLKFDKTDESEGSIAQEDS